MPQRTEVEPGKNPSDQSVAQSGIPAAAGAPAPPETHSASEPPPSRAGRFIQSNPNARLFLIAAILVVLVGGYLRLALFPKLRVHR